MAAPPIATPKRRTALAWSALEASLRQFLGISLSFVVLAFITPYQLGVFSLAYAIAAILMVFVDEPVCEALVQHPTIEAETWNSGFVFNLGAAGTACLLAAVLAVP